jgi:DNA-3-methyladenine glycosylase I
MVRTLKRCPWSVFDDPLYREYHDREWGVPVHNDRKIFEFLILESFQAGLSWRTVLHKRREFRKAFAGFNVRKVAKFTSRDVTRLMNNPGIIRNRAKIKAAVTNARAFLKVKREFGTFSRYMWSWVNGKPINNRLRRIGDYRATSPEAEAWSRDLKERGFKFLGPTVLYAHMQAVGMVNDHVTGCFRYRQLVR